MFRTCTLALAGIMFALNTTLTFYESVAVTIRSGSGATVDHQARPNTLSREDVVMVVVAHFPSPTFTPPLQTCADPTLHLHQIECSKLWILDDPCAGPGRAWWRQRPSRKGLAWQVASELY